MTSSLSAIHYIISRDPSCFTSSFTYIFSFSILDHFPQIHLIDSSDTQLASKFSTRSSTKCCSCLINQRTLSNYHTSLSSIDWKSYIGDSDLDFDFNHFYNILVVFPIKITNIFKDNKFKGWISSDLLASIRENMDFSDATNVSPQITMPLLNSLSTISSIVSSNRPKTDSYILASLAPKFKESMGYTKGISGET